MKALVADSDPDRLRQLEGWLSRWGHDVLPVRDGVEAWHQLEKEREPVLVVLAWRMEGMPGIDVCRRIRLQPELPSAYVLLIADGRAAEDLLDGLNAGADDFLFTPLDANETRARIRTGSMSSARSRSVPGARAARSRSCSRISTRSATSTSRSERRLATRFCARPLGG